MFSYLRVFSCSTCSYHCSESEGALGDGVSSLLSVCFCSVLRSSLACGPWFVVAVIKWVLVGTHVSSQNLFTVRETEKDRCTLHNDEGSIAWVGGGACPVWVCPANGRRGECLKRSLLQLCLCCRQTLVSGFPRLMHYWRHFIPSVEMLSFFRKHAKLKLVYSCMDECAGAEKSFSLIKRCTDPPWSRFLNPTRPLQSVSLNDGVRKMNLCFFRHCDWQLLIRAELLLTDGSYSSPLALLTLHPLKVLDWSHSVWV